MLRIALPEAERLHAAARDRDIETCAVGLSHPFSHAEREHFVVRDLVEVPPEAYATRTPIAASLKPEYCTHISNRARAAGAGVFIAHTHPGEHALEGFSDEDDRGEQALFTYFHRRMPQNTHFSAVFTANQIFARPLGQLENIHVVRVGRELIRPAQMTGLGVDQYDRQIRAFGTDGQSALSTLTVGIVGLGGTGSVVAQQLAHLGVNTFVLIDPDVVESTNLNRLVGAEPRDVGSLKVAVAGRSIKSVSTSASVTEVAGDVADEHTAQLLTRVDFIFGCTDSMASRAVMNQLAYQYLIPYIDVGVGISVLNGRVEYISGRAQMLSPGLPCLVCTDKLNAEQVRREMLTEEQRRQDRYITGAVVPQPAVISLNSTMSSAAVTMFLAAVTGFRSDARMLIYDGIRGSLRPAAGPPRPQCIVCSTDGALARGATWRLPTRKGGAND